MMVMGIGVEKKLSGGEL
jgi:hypothetical protein